MRNGFALFLAFTLCCSIASAELDWVLVNANPPQRDGHAMAYTNEGVLLFGGTGEGSRYRPYTWVWNGDDWILKYPQHSPGSRTHHGMVYDATREVVLLFGGYIKGDYSNQTWEWNGADWVLRQTEVSPGAMSDDVMAYDASRAVTVLHGGETWEWDGNSWTQLETQSVPWVKHDLAMGYDAAREVMVLFGSPEPVGPSSGQLWELRDSSLQ
jgi:hypothetical protein